MGCDDGSIRLFSLASNDLTHLRRLDRAKTRILSLAWGPPHYVAKPAKNVSDTSDSDDEEEEDEKRWEDSFIAAGCSDSSVRKWDLGTGRVWNA